MHPLVIIITLHAGTGLISRLIRWQTRSRYSHAGIILPDGRFAEAREDTGVRIERRFIRWSGEQVDMFAVTVSPEQAQAVDDFIAAQEGKPYDYTMVARFVSRRGASRSQSGKWFCSELVFAALQHAGVHLLRDTQPWEVSPGMLARSPLLSPCR